MLRPMLAIVFVVLLGFSADAVAQQGPKEKVDSAKSGVFEFVGFSTTPIAPGPNVGIPGMHKVCQDDFDDPDMRMCTRTEYFRSPTAILPDSDSWLDGSPNCLSWGAGSTDSGLFVAADGSIKAVNCGSAKTVTCCARLN